VSRLRPAAAFAAAALLLTAPAAPAGATAAAKPPLHFLTTQDLPGPPTYYAWGAGKPKPLKKPRGCWEPVLAGTPTSFRLFESDPDSWQNADPPRAADAPAAGKAALAFGVQYIAVAQNAAAADRLVEAIKDRLKECARFDVGTPKHPKKATYLSFGEPRGGDKLLIRAIHHSFNKTKDKPARAAVDAFGIGRDGRIVTVVSLTSVREDWGRGRWSPTKVVKGFIPTAKKAVAELR
jgi:hypothetical protein